MKKTLLAAALLAGFAGAAQAETSVTLYGLIDMGLGYNKVKADGLDSKSRIGMIDGVQNGSRWGLRGTEDLGDGLRAVFQVEGGFTPRNGSQGQNRLFGRHATLGLASDSWGQLDFGRQTNMASKYFGAIDPFGAGFGQANIGAAFSAANTLRLDNMVMYRTPNFGGFQAGIGYSFNTNQVGDGERFATADNQRAITAGVRYVNGPLNVALAYDRLNPRNDAVGGKDSARPTSWIIGGTYDFEVVKLALAYGQTRDGLFQQQAYSNPWGVSLPSLIEIDDLKIKSYLVGLSAPIGGASKVFASWHRADETELVDEAQDTFSVGYTYDLSKRTNLYVYGSYSKNVLFIEDAKSTAVGVGIRHRF